jgi:hypothetical protein
VTTETFEPLCWTACAYLVARGLIKEDRTSLIWAGVVAGVAMEAKYGMAFWLVGLAIGVLIFARKLLATRALWIGAALCVLISAPSLVWQAVHGWPFLEYVGGRSVTRGITGTPLDFALRQAFALNIILAPLWITGLVAPFAIRSLHPARFLPVAFAVTAAIIYLTHGKGYYLYPAYPALFAVGAAACQRLGKWIRWPWMALALAESAILAPIILPILDPPALARFLDRTHLRPHADEQAAIGAPLTQVFSDELGWRDLEKKVAEVYRSLPPDEQASVAILGPNYGEAAAIDVYGAADHLPAAISGSLEYWLWSPRGHDGGVMILINGDEERWSRLCASLERRGTFGAPLAMPYERDRPIFLCRARVPLQRVWERFKRYN